MLYMLHTLHYSREKRKALTKKKKEKCPTSSSLSGKIIPFKLFINYHKVIPLWLTVYICKATFTSSHETNSTNIS